MSKQKKVMVTVSHEELIDRLREQILFLQSSVRLFDEGQIAEAKRIALHIRILIHDTDKSKSLLNQLDFKQELLFTENLRLDSSGNMACYHGLVGMKMGKGEASYFAWLDDGPPFQIIKSTFQEWWLRRVIRDHDGVSFTRKDLVLTLANKEGGAHVDSELEQEYVRLSQENSLQYYFMVGNEARDWLNNPVPHTVRHIAHELLKTLYEQVPDAMVDKPCGYGCRINGLPT